MWFRQCKAREARLKLRELIDPGSAPADWGTDFHRGLGTDRIAGMDPIAVGDDHERDRLASLRARLHVAGDGRDLPGQRGEQVLTCNAAYKRQLKFLLRGALAQGAPQNDPHGVVSLRPQFDAQPLEGFGLRKTGLRIPAAGSVELVLERLQRHHLTPVGPVRQGLVEQS